MILGTVELGLAYGINNKQGKPNIDQAIEVLNAAWKGGIRELDTAAAYGDSEVIIGKYQETYGNKFKIDTKLPVSLDGSTLQDEFEKSCRRLKTDIINVLYLHSFEQCKDDDNIALLESLRDEGRIRHIGISVYEPNEMRYIEEHLPMVDVIQFPFNVFDNRRWMDNDLLADVRKKGILLYARSIYLQGLVFRDADDPFVSKLNIKPYVEHLHNLCQKERKPPHQFAYNYVCGIPEISDCLLGCDSDSQVKENIKIMSEYEKLPDTVVSSLENYMCGIPQIAIDPRRWNS